MVQVDRQIAAGRVERTSLQVQRAVGIVAAAEEQVLAGIEPQHRPAIKRARVRILRQQDRVVHGQQRKLVDHNRDEALVVPVLRGHARFDSQLAMGLTVEGDDVGHVRWAAGRSRESCGSSRGCAAAARASGG